MHMYICLDMHNVHAVMYVLETVNLTGTVYTHTHTLTSPECDFVVHRKCEQKVVIDCSSRLESALLQHDKQVEDVERIAATEDDITKEVRTCTCMYTICILYIACRT